jgi:hypothetical protein
MSILKDIFGTMPDGREVYSYILKKVGSFCSELLPMAVLSTRFLCPTGMEFSRMLFWALMT